MNAQVPNTAISQLDQVPISHTLVALGSGEPSKSRENPLKITDLDSSQSDSGQEEGQEEASKSTKFRLSQDEVDELPGAI